MERYENRAPVRKGDELEVEIEGVGEKGDGIARVEGFVLFVPETKKGDRVKIRVSKVLSSVGFAEVIGEAENLPEKSEDDGYVEMDDVESEEPEDSEDFGEELE